VGSCSWESSMVWYRYYGGDIGRREFAPFDPNTCMHYTASMVALVLNTSFLFPSLLICKNASHP